MGARYFLAIFNASVSPLSGVHRIRLDFGLGISANLSLSKGRLRQMFQASL